MRPPPRLASLGLLLALLGCLGSVPLPPSTITIDEDVIGLTVGRCALSNGSFRERLPDEATETLLRAAGETVDGRTVEVTARRSRSATAPQTVQTVQITVGERTGDLEALVLYRGYDRDEGRWVEIDPDDPSGRVEVEGPLMRFDGPRLRAAGTVARPGSGERIDASLEIHCPVDLDDTDVVAVSSPGGRLYAAAPISRSAAFHAS